MQTVQTNPDILATPIAPPTELGPRLAAYQRIISEWIAHNWFEVCVAVAVAIALFLVLSWLRRVAVRVARNTQDRASLTAISARTLARTSKFFRVMVAAELVNGFANAPAPVAKLIEILFTIAVVFQAAIWVREIILGLVERRAGQGDHEHDTLANAMVLIRLLVSFVIFAIAAIVILDNLGINVTGLIAGLGVGGIAIGLAAQGIFSDLFAAIAVIFDKPFKRGDVIRYDTTHATVEKIGMKSTRLRALTGEEIIIANSKLLDKEITNISGLHYRRTTYNIGIVYHTGPEKSRALPALLKAIVEDEGAKFERAGFVGFGDSALNFELVFDLDSSHEFAAVFEARHRIGLAIVEAFNAQGYEFAYPTQTTFTSAPDGTLVMPYLEPKTGPSAKRSKT
jgi:small-conductance mechanosensitive channel